MPDRIPDLDVQRALKSANVPHLDDSEALAASGLPVLARPRVYHKGGVVEKSGWAKVRKGEVVIGRHAAALLSGLWKKAKKRKKARSRTAKT